MKDRQRIELTPEELDGLIHRLDAGTLTEKDHEIIKAIIETYLILSQAAQDKDTRINKLLRMIFGAKTERADKILPPKPEADKADETPEDEDTDAVDKPKGHGKNGACAYTAAEKIAVPYTGLKPGDNCPLCPGGKVYPWAPGTVVRFTGGAPLQAKIWELQKLRCNLCGEIFAPRLPEEAGAEKYDESAGAMVALLRYGSGVPFNRIEQLQESMGIPLPASTQWEIVNTAAEPASYAYDELGRHGAQGNVIHNDDTPMKILSMVRDEDDERKGIFTTGMLSVVNGIKVVLFKTGRNHAGENMTDLLKLRDQSLGPPLQMCDALSRNISKAFGTILCNCMSHGRRNFVDVVNSFPEECGHVIETLAGVYKNDETAKKQNMTPHERLLYHQAQSGPLMEGLFTWMKDQIDGRKTEPNSGLGKAIYYMLNHWEPLTRFLKVEGAPLDNNLCEQALKMAILHRKNSLFYKTLRGAHVGDIFMSLIHTCRLSNVNPFDYLVALQKHSAEVARNPQDWLPWNYTAAAAMPQPV
ncbi:MAG: IS66 family transposase [Nitrospiraceae bacterium]|nr:IS66 family transposase [Nitrospiraceae bacterium]